MIREILVHYTARLDEYLQRRHYRREGIAEVGFIGNFTKEKPCKIVVSLVNIERDTSGGIGAGMRSAGQDGFLNLYPPLMLNLDFMLAAVYTEKRYAESLAVLSDALTFIQSNPSFVLDGQTYTIEIVALSTQDIYNIWNTLGGQYYPSVMCKLRRVLIDSAETSGSGRMVKQPEVQL